MLLEAINECVFSGKLGKELLCFVWSSNKADEPGRRKRRRQFCVSLLTREQVL